MSIKEHLKHITHIPKECLSVTPPVPKSCKIEITSRCNYKCQYCAITFRKKFYDSKEMEWALFCSITEEMRKLGVEEVGVFYIGESFTCQTLPDYIEYLKKQLNFPYVFLTSNASLATPQAVEACMEAGLDSLKWSCNASSSTQFEELMGVDSVLFDKAKSHIASAFDVRNKGKYKTKLYASSIKYNDEQIRSAESFLSTYVIPFVDEHYWLPLYTAGGQAKDKEAKLGMKPIAGNTGRLDDPAEPLPCWTLFTEAHIMVDGRMTACCLDGIGKWVMGDLREQTFMTAWHSEKFQELRRHHLNKDVSNTVCKECALY